ncbi:CHAD domain-containing protein [Aliifodinibius sp. S!AR15-10]|nr:CHAD domain-containing protein [Aliifodinibius sp. S!AR15-10]
MRALIRLIRTPLGEEDYKQLNLFFRDMSRFVSELRDTHVIILILQHVATEAHSVRHKDIEQGLDELQRREQRLLEKAEEKNAFEEMANSLEENCESFLERDLIADNLPDLRPGVQEIFRNGREKFNLANEDGTKEHFHEWRKEVKYLLHIFQILNYYWPEELDINGKSLTQLSDYLGEEHDLALFDTLLRDDDFGPLLSNKKAMTSYVDQKRSFLQRSALNLGGFIYSKSEEEFISYFT